MNLTDRVSIIIPCYNGARFLAEAINSILAQTYPAAEIIVVDDGSTDQTPQIAARYRQVTYIYQPNQGAAVARNRGIQASKGNYLVFLDSDDRLLPQALEVGMQSFQTSPDCGFTFGECRRVDREGLPLSGQVYTPATPIPVYETLLSGLCLHPPARFIFQRQVIERIGGFDPMLRSADDYDFYIRAAAAFPGYGHHQEVVEYRVHSASITNVTRSCQHFSESMIIFRKQSTFVQAHPTYRPIHQKGVQHWINIYGPYMTYDAVYWLKKGKPGQAAKALSLVLRYYPQGLIAYGKELAAKLTNRKQPHPSNSR